MLKLLGKKYFTILAKKIYLSKSVLFQRVTSLEPPSCPICLHYPTAAKMTRCGHIYCWACILHYLTLGEKTWRKCPICYESIHSDDLKR